MARAGSCGACGATCSGSDRYCGECGLKRRRGPPSAVLASVLFGVAFGVAFSVAHHVAPGAKADAPASEARLPAPGTGTSSAQVEPRPAGAPRVPPSPVEGTPTQPTLVRPSGPPTPPPAPPVRGPIPQPPVPAPPPAPPPPPSPPAPPEDPPPLPPDGTEVRVEEEGPRNVLALDRPPTPPATPRPETSRPRDRERDEPLLDVRVEPKDPRFLVELLEVDTSSGRAPFLVVGEGSAPPPGTYLGVPPVATGVRMHVVAVTVPSGGGGTLRVGPGAARALGAGARLSLTRARGLPEDLVARMPGWVPLTEFGDALSPLPLQRKLAYRLRVAADGASASATAPQGDGARGIK